MNTKQMLCVMTLAGLCACNLEANPDISGVTVRQRWPWSRLVDIDFVVVNATEPFDVTVQAWNGNNALTLPENSLTGIYGISADGVHHIVFDPLKTAYTNAEVLSDFHVALTATNVPLYMIVDLTKTAGADGQIEYIYPGDARLETYGKWTNVWFGVTNDIAYATSKLVMRRIKAGTYKLGTYPPQNNVTLTHDYYAGVFDVTKYQWGCIMADVTNVTPSMPQGRISYNDIRGSMDNIPTVNWPSTGTFVSPTNFLGLLRSRTGLPGFDLPTRAQWETLCRAGTTSYFNDGESTSQDDTNILKRIAWYFGNAVTLYTVGQLESNNWGLYDTLGNTYEWCLDWSGAASETATDPTGPLTGSNRIYMSHNRSGAVRDFVPSVIDGNIPTLNTTSSLSFRLVRVLW